MSEEFQIQIKIEAARLAVAVLQNTAVEDGDIAKLAKEIFEFLKGETK